MKPEARERMILAKLQKRQPPLDLRPWHTVVVDVLGDGLKSDKRRDRLNELIMLAAAEVLDEILRPARLLVAPAILVDGKASAFDLAIELDFSWEYDESGDPDSPAYRFRWMIGMQDIVGQIFDALIEAETPKQVADMRRRAVSTRDALRNIADRIDAELAEALT